MAATRITKYIAGQIATKIAERAFEHLVLPLEREKQALFHEQLIEIYGLFSENQLDAMEKLGILEYNKHIGIVFIGSDRNEHISCEMPKKYLTPDNWNNSFKVIGEDRYVRACNLQKRIEDMERRRRAMSKEIEAQITGKTAVKVVELWPEAGEIVKDVLGDDYRDGGVTAPLEVLLARFLPALPAPTKGE